MSQKNIESVERAAAAVSRRDIEALLAELDPDVEWHGALAALLGGKPTVYRGHDGVRDWLRDQEAAFDEINIDYSEVRDLGERIVLIGHFRARGRMSGAKVETPAAWVVEVKNGKVGYAKAYFDVPEALDAAGPST
jgi:ketosteroid isomerase-like protein